VTIIEENHHLIFVHGQKKVMESSLQKFLSDPDKAMSEFSDRCDINSFFRKITFLSLLLGMPITIYIMVHTLVMLALFFITSPNLRFGISAGVSLIIGVSATIPLYYVFSKPLAQADIIGLLNSKDWRIRTAALRKISEDGMGIDQFMDQIDYSKFYHIPEKYWFARALSQSRNENTIIILHKYLQEPYPNVVCMALYSLGKRNHRASMDLILDLIQSSPQWYVQWYAYKALRRMGWAQPKPR
jgi:hypothetical protein